ncbi:hypothetical protein VTN02DRAFT_4325 [Thermoascus thermophilus]
MDASVAGSATARNQSLDQLSSPDNPAGPVSSNRSSSSSINNIINNNNNNKTSHHHGHDRQRDDGDEKEDDAEERHRHHHHQHHHQRPRRLFIDPSDLDRDQSKSRRRHKHSKSRPDIRLPRTMNQIAASSGARSLFPTRSSAGKDKDKDKDRDADDGLLRPTMTRSTTRSRLGSESTSGPETGSRKGSLVDDGALGLVKRREIRTMEDLERERERRQLGEAYVAGISS